MTTISLFIIPPNRSIGRRRRSGKHSRAIAYVYAPYFLVDLYVRTAFAEFSAFPFYPLALYGFARHASEGRRRHLVLGIVGYAGVWFAHSPAALLFLPLLGAFLLFLAWRERSWRVLAMHVAACVVALLIAACVWLPALAGAGASAGALALARRGIRGDRRGDRARRRRACEAGVVPVDRSAAVDAARDRGARRHSGDVRHV